MQFDFRKFPRLRLAVLLFTSLLGPSLRAQKDTGNIVGTVRDASGAMVTGAKVTVRDLEHGTSFATSSNDAGEYFAGPLRIGHYTISVEKEGFKTAVAGPVELNVQDRLVVDVTLQVGVATEKMI
ncbi:MAG: TonB-dependent receptor, partial [Acidobacteria bacterium]